MRRHPSRCKVCGRTRDAEEPISALGYCSVHGIEAQNANNVQLSEGNGAYYEHWLRRSLMAAQRRLVALEREGA